MYIHVGQVLLRLFEMLWRARTVLAKMCKVLCRGGVGGLYCAGDSVKGDENVTQPFPCLPLLPAS